MTITVGSLLQRIERDRDTDERFSFFMPRANGPCRFGVYNLLHKIVLERVGWKDRVSVWSPADSDYFEDVPAGFTALLFAGFCVLIGVLILRSRLLPRAIGAMMILAGICYVVNTLALIVSPGLFELLNPTILLPILLACIALASTLLGRRRAMLLATGACFVLVLVTVGRMNGWTLTELLGVSSAPADFGWTMAIRLLAQLTAIYAVALLGSRLGGGLRHAERINDLAKFPSEEETLAVARSLAR